MKTSLLKRLLEQPKFFEFIRKDHTKNNIFISGVPNETTIEGDVENNDVNILQSVLNVTTLQRIVFYRTLNPKTSNNILPSM